MIVWISSSYEIAKLLNLFLKKAFWRSYCFRERLFTVSDAPSSFIRFFRFLKVSFTIFKCFHVFVVFVAIIIVIISTKQTWVLQKFKLKGKVKYINLMGTPSSYNEFKNVFEKCNRFSRRCLLFMLMQFTLLLI